MDGAGWGWEAVLPGALTNEGKLQGLGCPGQGGVRSGGGGRARAPRPRTASTPLQNTLALHHTLTRTHTLPSPPHATLSTTRYPLHHTLPPPPHVNPEPCHLCPATFPAGSVATRGRLLLRAWSGLLHTQLPVQCGAHHVAARHQQGPCGAAGSQRAGVWGVLLCNKCGVASRSVRVRSLRLTGRSKRNSSVGSSTGTFKGYTAAATLTRSVPRIESPFNQRRRSCR